jgi:hypothetical protein
MSMIAGFFDISLSSTEADGLLQAMAYGDNSKTENHSQYLNLPIGLAGSATINTTTHALFNHLCVYLDGEISNASKLIQLLPKEYFTQLNIDNIAVIKAAYLHWGEDCLAQLEGEFAFALWDKNKEILFCARDILGVKPFHYLHEHHCFYFGTTIHQVKNSPIFNHELHLEQAYKGIMLGFNHFIDETIYSQIKLLPPGCRLSLTNNLLTVKSYQNKADNLKIRPIEGKSIFNLYDKNISTIKKEDFDLLNAKSPIPIWSARFLMKYHCANSNHPRDANEVLSSLAYNSILYGIAKAADELKRHQYLSGIKRINRIAKKHCIAATSIAKSTVQIAFGSINKYNNKVYHKTFPLLYDNANWFNLRFNSKNRQEQVTDFQISVHPIATQLYENAIITNIIGFSNEAPLLHEQCINCYTPTTDNNLEDELLRNQLVFLLEIPLKLPVGFNHSKAERLINRYKKGDYSLSKIVWRIVTFNYWLATNKY